MQHTKVIGGGDPLSVLEEAGEVVGVFYAARLCDRSDICPAGVHEADCGLNLPSVDVVGQSLTHFPAEQAAEVVPVEMHGCGQLDQGKGFVLMNPDIVQNPAHRRRVSAGGMILNEHAVLSDHGVLQLAVKQVLIVGIVLDADAEFPRQLINIVGVDAGLTGGNAAEGIHDNQIVLPIAQSAAAAVV